MINASGNDLLKNLHDRGILKSHYKRSNILQAMTQGLVDTL